MTDKEREPNELAVFVGPVWSETKASQSLGVKPDGLGALASVGGVLRLVTADGEAVYPVWQFSRRGGQVEVKPGLVPLFRVLSGFDGWTVALLLHTPAPELEGLSPLDWLAAEGRDAEAVANLAVVAAREWSAGASV